MRSFAIPSSDIPNLGAFHAVYISHLCNWNDDDGQL